MVGDSAGGEGDGGTEFSAGWDPDQAGRFAPQWVERNLLSGGLLDVDDLVATVHTLLSLGPGASVPSLTLTPKPAEAVAAEDAPPGIDELA